MDKVKLGKTIIGLILFASVWIKIRYTSYGIWYDGVFDFAVLLYSAEWLVDSISLKKLDETEVKLIEGYRKIKD